jgi:hypothetical protein
MMHCQRAVPRRLRVASAGGAKDFRQQRLNGSADRSAAEGGRILPHFQQIVSGALMPPWPITAVF